MILGNNHHELQTIHHPRINHLYHLLKGWIVKGLYKIFCNNPNNYEGIVKGLYHLLFGRISHIYTICLKGWIVKGLYKIFSWEEWKIIDPLKKSLSISWDNTISWDYTIYWSITPLRSPWCPWCRAITKQRWGSSPNRRAERLRCTWWSRSP